MMTTLLHAWSNWMKEAVKGELRHIEYLELPQSQKLTAYPRRSQEYGTGNYLDAQHMVRL